MPDIIEPMQISAQPTHVFASELLFDAACAKRQQFSEDTSLSNAISELSDTTRVETESRESKMQFLQTR